MRGRELFDFKRGKFSALIFKCIYYTDTNQTQTSPLLTVNFPDFLIKVFRKHTVFCKYCKAPNKRLEWENGIYSQWTPKIKYNWAPPRPKQRSFRFPLSSRKVAGLPCADPKRCLFSLHRNSFIKELLNEQPSVITGRRGLVLNSHNPQSQPTSLRLFLCHKERVGTSKSRSSLCISSPVSSTARFKTSRSDCKKEQPPALQTSACLKSVLKM